MRGNRTFILVYFICGILPLEFRMQIFWSQPVQCLVNHHSSLFLLLLLLLLLLLFSSIKSCLLITVLACLLACLRTKYYVSFVQKSLEVG